MPGHRDLYPCRDATRLAASKEGGAVAQNAAPTFSRQALPELSVFLAQRGNLEIAHHVPGRIRIRLNVNAFYRAPHLDPTPVIDLIRRMRGVRTTRINAAALSIVIEYDPRILPQMVWERLLRGEKAEVEQILVTHVG